MTMNRNHAEVYHQMSEFLSESGSWTSWLEFAEQKGINPTVMSAALNEAAGDAGYSQELTPEDCQP